MNDYVRADQPVVDNRKALPPLSDAEQARTAEARAFVLEHMPDLIPWIREFVAIGYMDGWRDVENCKKLSQEIAK